MNPPLPSRRTRLVATIGPASVDVLDGLVAAGLDVARINLSHGTRVQHSAAVSAVRRAAERAGRSIGILVDLPGPKLRLGSLPGGSVELAAGAVVTLSSISAHAGGAGLLPLRDAAVLDSLRVGDRVLLADGEAELRVLTGDGAAVEAEVVRGGSVRSGAGVSVPAGRMPTDALSAADEARIPHLIGLEPDFVGQSFVRSVADVQALRACLPASIAIVAKIETRPAVEAIDEIVAAADAIMVARGDLGVELPFERVPLVQKDLVAAALRAGRPSIVATQMLESMVEAPIPTRAEASDVANAILDGADAVMLSAETAIGAWPQEALGAAARICAATDESDAVGFHVMRSTLGQDDARGRATLMAAITLADEDPAVVALACFTRSGRTASRLSSMRPRVPVVAFTDSAACARSLSLRRGVISVVLGVPSGRAPDSGVVEQALRSGGAGWSMPAGAAVVLVTSRDGGAPDRLDVLRTRG